MVELRTRTEILAGFAAALLLTSAAALAMHQSARELSRELFVLSARQLPAQRQLSALEAALKESQRVENAQALARATAEVLTSVDCRGCHDGPAVDADRGPEALNRVEEAMAALDALPRSGALDERWPPLRKDLVPWLDRARRATALVAQRDRLLGAGSSAVPGVAGRSIEIELWEVWRDLHQGTVELDLGISSLRRALDAEGAAAQSAQAAAERRQELVGTWGLGAVGVALLVLGLLVGRAMTRTIRSVVRAAAAATASPEVVPGELRPLVEAMTRRREEWAGPLRAVAECAGRLARGEAAALPAGPLPPELRLLGEALSALAAVERELRGELGRVAAARAAGEGGARLDEDRFPGTFRELAVLVNAAFEAQEVELRRVAESLASVGAGDLESAAADPALVGRLRTSLRRIGDELRAVTAQAAQGRLSARADLAQFPGEWRSLAESLNALLDALASSVKAAVRHGLA
ncbi:MAG TPA: hypothetical protein VFG59_08740, partial [Anaeromyxobacter sp.]|nr:hypothetical protein [Anaeromyxobacter sp.]